MPVSAELGNVVKQKLAVEHVMPVARGTTALWLALRTLARSGRQVLVPVNVCESVIAAILAADLQPVYVDVDPVEGLISIDRLDDALCEECSVLIAVHNFGTPLPIANIADWCRARDIVLLEDCCNSVGAIADGRPVGCWGEAAAYSFGKGKNLDLQRGGLLAFQDRYALQEATELADLLPAWTTTAERSEAKRQRALRQLRSAGKPVDPATYRELFPKGDAALFARAGDGWHETLLRGMRSLSSEIDLRNRNAAYYREFLCHPLIKHRRMVEGEACWRYTMHVPEAARDGVVTALRDENVPVSTWYPPVDRLFGPACGPTRLPGAYRFQQTVINLFVDANVTMPTREKCCRVIQQVLDVIGEA